MENKTHERPYKNKPLTEIQIQNNNKKSKTRVRVEHVFASIKQRAEKKIIRTIGIERAEVKIGLRNLLYNIERFVYYQEKAVLKTA
jgi:tetrahydromethanopterin S-methyltransferase subunit G